MLFVVLSSSLSPFFVFVVLVISFVCVCYVCLNHFPICISEVFKSNVVFLLIVLQLFSLLVCVCFLVLFCGSWLKLIAALIFRLLAATESFVAKVDCCFRELCVWTQDTG